MKSLNEGNEVRIITRNNKRITKTARLLQRFKLPQIIDVTIGNISIVGVRPDVESHANKIRRRQ